MNTGIIIQARSDSSRFPNKVFQLIKNQPILWHVIQRCKWMKLPIIVATSDRNIDDEIESISKSCNVECFRGSKDDVLDRFYQTAKKYSLKYVIRITADCPLIDPRESIKVLDLIKSSNLDYVRLDENTYPDGMDTEVFTFDSLKKTWINAKLKSEREHVTPYIYNPNNEFKTKIISFKKNVSHYRWAVDYPNDLKFIRKIYDELYHDVIFFSNDVLKLLEKKPELTKINSNHSRNDGYVKSLREDNY